MAENQTILLVEDDAVLSEMYLERFKGEKWAAVCVHTGEEAKQVLEKEPVGLVLLDIMLPGISGLDVLAWIRATESIKELPVFLLSALNTEEDKTRGRELGATGYLAKSETTPEQVVATVKKYL